MLNTFGDLIENLQVDFYKFDTASEVVIMQLIHNKCSKSLKTLKMENAGIVIFKKWKNSFDGVSLLKISMSSNFVNYKENINRELSKFFPNIVILEIKNTSFNIYGSFPRLSSIKMDDSNYNLTDFFTKNQQIESLTLDKPSLKLLGYVKILPKLKFLSIKTDKTFVMDTKFEDDAIHFNTVENVIINTFDDHIILEKITFNQISSLTINFVNSTAVSDKWTEFIERQSKSLNAFEINTKYVTRDQLLMIPNKCPELSALKISCESKFNSDDITKLVKTGKHFTVLNLRIDLTDSNLNSFGDSLPDWSVTVDGNEVSLTKK